MSAKRFSVVVIGGGYGGIRVARLLDADPNADLDVTLVEPHDTFAHNVAALRAVVDEDWAATMFLGYDRLLRRGRVLRDRAVRVDAHHVELGSGRALAPDYVVVATGSAYPFPAKMVDDDASASRDRLARVRADLHRASSVLLLGAGPVGLELAGELRDTWPTMPITVVDPSDDVLAGRLPAAFRATVRDQLAALDVRLLLARSLREPPSSEPGVLAPVGVRTDRDEVVEADIWFRCYGTTPVADFLAGSLAAARRPDGSVAVDEHLAVAPTVFALGDVTDVPEPKMAKAAELHAEVVAANILALTRGEPAAETYPPAPESISLPLGRRGGASYSPAVGILGPERTAELKGSHLKIDVYREALGLDATSDGERAAG